MEQDRKLLLAKAEDQVRLAKLRNIPKFSGFLSPGEATEIAQAIKAPGICFFGGYPDAERRIFGVLPDYITEPETAFPITPLKISYRAADHLSHRDVLGALMATGITRDRVGDIRFGEHFAVVFTVEEIADYLVEQITKIGRVGVTVMPLSLSEAACTFPPPKKQPLSFTVSSTRLDAVVSGLTGCGRSKAEQLITDGSVFVNSFAVTKSTKKVQAEDRISIRGIGKYQIISTGNFSKKGREIVMAEKYI